MNTYGRYPLTIERGNGTFLYDNQNVEYVDCAAGIATCCLGHAHPALSKAVADQMNQVHHCSNLYYIPAQASLASWLVKNSCADKVFFCNSGAEANEAAIKLARKYAHTKLGIDHPVIITAVNSFHGRTLTAITATGQPKYQKDFGPLTPGFEYVEYNNLAELKEKVKEIQGRGNGHGLAGIMMESLQGEGGIRPGTTEFFQGIRQLCDETGALMMMDEVQTGMGRTGHLWGYESIGVEPDVFSSAKALGGGVPIGAMLCKDKCNVFGPGDHASTYGGNPLACAAGVAVAKAFEEEGILENVQRRGEQFRQLARTVLQNKYPKLISEVRGWGLINGIELSADQPLTAADVTKALMVTEHVLVVPAGPKVIRFVPPLIIDEETINVIINKVDKVLSTLTSTPTA
eukprot:gene14654-10479_t